MTLPDPPEAIYTKNGLTSVHVLPWVQYIKRRIKQNGVRYLFGKTSAGYPRFLSLGYYSKSKKEIVVSKVGNWQLRVNHETGHVNGFEHVDIWFNVMNPYGILRSSRVFTCTAKHNCTYGNAPSRKCFLKCYSAWCQYIKVECK